MFRKHWQLVLILLLLHAAFFVVQCSRQNYFLDDSAEYISAADNLLGSGTLYSGDLEKTADPALFTKRTPGYPIFLAISRMLTHSMFPVLLLQSLLSLVSILIMVRIFISEQKLSLWTAGFLLFLPAQFIYANMIMSEILLQFLIMLMAWSAWSYFTKKKRKFMWAYQLLLVAAILVKPVMYIFVIPNILLFVVLYVKYRRRLDMTSCLIPLVFVLLFAGFNQQRTGYFHVSSIQQINLVNYNVYYFIMEKDGVETAEETRTEILRTCATAAGLKDHSLCLNREAGRVIKEDPVKYGIFHAKGMIRYFIDPGRFDIYNYFGIERERGKGFLYHLNSGGFMGGLKYLFDQPVYIILWLLVIAFLNVVKAAGFLFYLFNKKINADFRLFLFLLIATLSFATGPLGASRFMLPVALLMMGAALYQYHHWYMVLRQKKAGA